MMKTKINKATPLNEKNQEVNQLDTETAEELSTSLQDKDGEKFLEIFKKNKQAVIAQIKGENKFQEVIGSFEENSLIVILDLIKDQDREYKTDHRRELLSEDEHASYRKCYVTEMQYLAIYILEVFDDKSIELIQKNDQEAFKQVVDNKLWILGAEMIVILWKIYNKSTDNIKKYFINLLKDILCSFKCNFVSIYDSKQEFGNKSKTTTLFSFFEILKENYNQMNFSNENEQFIKNDLIILAHFCGSIEIQENIVKILGENYFKGYQLNGRNYWLMLSLAIHQRKNKEKETLLLQICKITKLYNVDFFSDTYPIENFFIIILIRDSSYKLLSEFCCYLRDNENSIQSYFVSQLFKNYGFILVNKSTKLQTILFNKDQQMFLETIKNNNYLDYKQLNDKFADFYKNENRLNILIYYQRHIEYLLSCFYVHDKILDKRKDQKENDLVVSKLIDRYKKESNNSIINQAKIKKFYGFVQQAKNKEISKLDRNLQLSHIQFDDQNKDKNNIWYNVQNLVILMQSSGGIQSALLKTARISRNVVTNIIGTQLFAPEDSEDVTPQFIDYLFSSLEIAKPMQIKKKIESKQGNTNDKKVNNGKGKKFKVSDKKAITKK